MRAGFLVNEVYSGLRRNVTMTIAMILTTAISIGLFGGGLLVIQLAKQSRNIYLDRVESQVFLNNDVSANDPRATPTRVKHCAPKSKPATMSRVCDSSTAMTPCLLYTSPSPRDS